MTTDPRVLAAQLFVEKHLADKNTQSYVELLAVRDALRPYVEDMHDAGWYPDCEECYEQLRAEWREVNQALDRYRQGALQRWRSRRNATRLRPASEGRRP